MKLKKKHRQAREELGHLRHSLALSRRETAKARTETSWVRTALERLIENVQNVERMSAALPEAPSGPDPAPGQREVIHRRPLPFRGFHPFDESSVLEPLRIAEKILYRLQLGEEPLQQALGAAIAFRVTHDGWRVTQKLEASWLLSRGALRLPNVREQVALDIARSLVDRLAAR